jgi:hypothetical protein
VSGDIVVNGTTYRQYDGEWFEVESEYRRRFLTPQEHAALVEIERLRAAGDALAKSLAEFNDPFYTLGPPPELFVKSEVTFTVTIKEWLWPGNQQVTVEELLDCLYKWMNPRTPTITVTETPNNE